MKPYHDEQPYPKAKIDIRKFDAAKLTAISKKINNQHREPIC